MRRLSILSLIAVLSLVGLGTAPASAKGATTTTFTIKYPVLVLVDAGSSNAVSQGRGLIYQGEVLSSDGRVVGYDTSILNFNWIKGGGPWDYEARMWGTWRIDNADGSWEGTWTGSRGPGDTAVHIIDAVGRGSGAYEGLHIRYHMEGIGLENYVGTGEILDPGHH